MFNEKGVLKWQMYKHLRKMQFLHLFNAEFPTSKKRRADCFQGQPTQEIKRLRLKMWSIIAQVSWANCGEGIIKIDQSKNRSKWVEQCLIWSCLQSLNITLFLYDSRGKASPYNHQVKGKM